MGLEEVTGYHSVRPEFDVNVTKSLFPFSYRMAPILEFKQNHEEGESWSSPMGLVNQCSTGAQCRCGRCVSACRPGGKQSLPIYHAFPAHPIRQRACAISGSLRWSVLVTEFRFPVV